MKINSKYLRRIFNPALEMFLQVELSSIMNDISERNLCARLAMHLEHQMKIVGLQGYYADPEYNRMQDGQVKTMLSDQMEVINITCDLIVHSRGEIMGKDNLIALEMSKPNKSADEVRDDKNRLRALTKSTFDDIWSNDGKTHPEHVCGYVIGLFMMVNRRTREITIDKFFNGEESQVPEVIPF
jgi:hypothetical protein